MSDDSQMNQIPPQLDYAPAPPMAHRAIVLRVFRWLVFVLLLAGGLFWGPGLWRQGKFLFRQRQAMAFSLPPEQVVYTNRPLEEKGLSTEKFKPVFVRTQLGQMVSASVGKPENGLGYSLSLLDPLGEGTVAGYVTGGMTFQRSSIGMTVPRTGAFLHARKAAASSEKLVGVFFAMKRDGILGDQFQELELNALTWQPATWAGDPAMQLMGVSKLTVAVLRDSSGEHHVRVFAGQPSASADRFTMRYEIDGKAGTIEGTLDDSDSVQFRVLDGPLKDAAKYWQQLGK